jgi:hypothetical protein
MSHKEAVIYDLEWTTWLGTLEREWSERDEYREIIRIGAISIDLYSLQEIEVLDVIVKPSINPILSDYCVKLTDITDEQIQAEGIELHEAIHKFVDFVRRRNTFHYGNDILIILENLWLNNITFNARTLQSDRPIVINEYNQTDSCLESNVVEVTLYGLNRLNTQVRISEGVRVEINLHGSCVPLTHTNLGPWFHANAPETQGKFSGEIAKALGVSELKGNIHNPLFDVRSILMGLRELVLSRHIENPLK